MGSPRECANSPDLKGPMRSTTSISVETGKKSGHGFLHKLFSRQASIPKLTTMEIEEDLTAAPLDDVGELTYSDLKVMPCPYIRPLGNRLEPRVENAPLGPRRPVANSTMSILRKKGESSRAARSCNDMGEGPESGLAASDIMDLRSLRLREDIATAAAADSSHLKDWGYYIKCYSEGRYSLIMPPGPPPMSPLFTYLPSTYPTNEATRLATFQSSDKWSGTDIIWSEPEVECARSLIKAATAKFDSPWGAISFFDHDTEIVQAERGYSRHFIPRRESIASHVLLTNEVMTVLDTQQDWRFAGNPLVVGNPKIRFFAGAPLLSSNSEVIGVFAVFSPKPRANFTARQRRELTGYSEMAMQDLTSLKEVTYDDSIRHTPILQRDSLVNGISRSIRPTLDSRASNGNLDSSLIPSALQYHKASHHRKSRSQVIINKQSRDALTNPTEYTPPTSDDSDDGPSPVSAQLKAFGKNRKQLVPSAMPDPPRDISITPDSPSFGDWPPNFDHFSRSEFTSVSQLPHPCTLESSYADGTTPSLYEAGSHTKTFSSDDAVILLTPRPNTSNDQFAHASSDPIGLGHDRAFLDAAIVFGQRLDTPVLKDSEIMWAYVQKAVEAADGDVKKHMIENEDDRATISSVSTDIILGEANEPLDPHTEVKFAAEFWAKSLDFDAIYAVELIPKRLFMSDDELQAPGGVETHVLVSYGLHEPIDFDIAMHLDVLRSPGAIMWENNNGMPEEYSRGFMMPLVFGFGMLQLRSSGVVFGAFRKTPEDGNEMPKLNSAEIERLGQAARVLKNILYKSRALRRPSQCRTELPPSPSPPAYPANEAVEVGKYSLDTGTERFARKRKPGRRQPQQQ